VSEEVYQGEAGSERPVKRDFRFATTGFLKSACPDEHRDIGKHRLVRLWWRLWGWLEIKFFLIWDFSFCIYELY